MTKSQLQQGISYVMGSDLPKSDIESIWIKHDANKDGKLDFKEFSLSIFNRELMQSYYKNKGTETFLAGDKIWFFLKNYH